LLAMLAPFRLVHATLEKLHAVWDEVPVSSLSSPPRPSPTTVRDVQTPIDFMQVVDCLSLLTCPCGVAVSVLDINLEQCACLSCKCGRRLCAICGFVAFDNLHGHYHVQKEHGFVYATPAQFVTLHRERWRHALSSLAHVRIESLDAYLDAAPILELVSSLHGAYRVSCVSTRLTAPLGEDTVTFSIGEVAPLLSPLQRAVALHECMQACEAASVPHVVCVDNMLATAIGRVRSLLPYDQMGAYLQARWRNASDEELHVYPFSERLYTVAYNVHKSTVFESLPAGVVAGYCSVLSALLAPPSVCTLLDMNKRACIYLTGVMMQLVGGPDAWDLEYTRLAARLHLRPWNLLARITNRVYMEPMWCFLNRPSFPGTDANARESREFVVAEMVGDALLSEAHDDFYAFDTLVKCNLPVSDAAVANFLEARDGSRDPSLFPMIQRMHEGRGLFTQAQRDRLFAHLAEPHVP